MSKANEINPAVEREVWDWCTEAGVAFSVWTHSSGSRSRITASLDGYAISEMVEHGDPREWKLTMTLLLRRLQQKLGRSGEQAAMQEAARTG